MPPTARTYKPPTVAALVQRADGYAGPNYNPITDPLISGNLSPPSSYVYGPRPTTAPGDVYGPYYQPPPTHPSLATNNAGFGVQGPPAPPTTELPAIDALRDQFQQAWDKQQQLLDMDLEDIAAAYGGDLTALEKVLADLKKQRAASGAATADFRGDIDTIHGAAPTGELDALPTSTAVEDVKKVYDGAEGELLEVLTKIDSDIHPDVAAAATGQLREMENYIEDQLRTDLTNIDNVHAAASQASVALANMAYADDAYGAARSQALLDAQLAKAVQDQADALAAKKAEMAAAMDRARERAAVEFQYEQPGYDESYQLAMEEYFRGQGLNSAETAKMMGLYNSVKDSGGDGAMLNEATWRKALDKYNTEFILGQLGALDNMEAWSAQILRDAEASGSPEEIGRANERVRQLGAWFDEVGIDLAEAFQTNNTSDLDRIKNLFVSSGIMQEREAQQFIDLGVQEADQFMAKGSAEYGYLRDAYTRSKEFDTSWSDILTGSMQFGDEELYVAPAGSAYAGYTFPVVGFVWHSGSGGYLYQDSDWQHMGVDIGAYRGSPVVAPYNGNIKDSGYHPVSGNYVIVTDTEGLDHFFGHLDTLTDIADRTAVSAGTMIGTVGNTGNASGKGPHIHYEIRQGNNRLNPMDFINATGGQNVGDPPANYATGTYTAPSSGPS